MKEVIEENPGGRKQFLLGTTRHVGRTIVRERGLLIGEARKLSNDIEAVSPADTLDRSLRADAAADRSLSRTMDRLERRQRRRMRERSPTPECAARSMNSGFGRSNLTLSPTARVFVAAGRSCRGSPQRVRPLP
jgi:hypothetical protein